MLLLWISLIALVSAICGVFFYVQALMAGLGKKRWAFAGSLLGPILWPMFAMEKRIQVNQVLGLNQLIFRA